MSKVLVTGAGGFIGSHLVERLVADGAEVRAFVEYDSRGSWGWLDEAALTVDMVSDGDNQTLIDIVADNRPLTIRGADLRDAVDKAMKRHNAGMTC